MPHRRLTLLAVAAAALTACSAAVQPPPAETAPPLPDMPPVEWSRYAPEVRQRIDWLAQTRRCAALDAEFHTVAAAARQADAPVLTYIAAAQRQVGCL